MCLVIIILENIEKGQTNKVTKIDRNSVQNQHNYALKEGERTEKEIRKEEHENVANQEKEGYKRNVEVKSQLNLTSFLASFMKENSKTALCEEQTQVESSPDISLTEKPTLIAEAEEAENAVAATRRWRER